MSIQLIIDTKNKHIDKLISWFDGNFEAFANAVLKDLEVLFKSNELSKEAIEEIFNRHGFNEMIQDFMEQYPTLFKFAKQSSKELGISDA